MKQEKKTVSVRLAMEDYEKLKEMADFFAVPLSQIIALSIHSGLMLADGVATHEKKEEEND